MLYIVENLNTMKQNDLQHYMSVLKEFAGKKITKQLQYMQNLFFS